MPPKFLYFDLGNVLLNFCNQRMVRQMAEVAGVEERAIRAALFPTGTERDAQWLFEAGHLTPKEFYDWVCWATRSRPDRAELEHAYSDIFDAIDASLELVTQLAAAGHRLGILSNTNALHWRFVTDGRYPAVNKAFELYVTSFDAISMKPDSMIYDHASQRAGLPPQELFFVDDKPENVAGARAAGFDAAPFISTEQLAQDLRTRGIEW